MTRYRLLKDLPGYKAGTVFEWDDSIREWLIRGKSVGFHSAIHCMLSDEGNNYPDWFQEIKEPERWRAEDGDAFWYVDVLEGCAPQKRTDNYGNEYDQMIRESGNYFKTLKEAEAVAEAIKAVLDYVHTPYPKGDDDARVRENAVVDLQELTLVKARQAIQSDNQQSISEGEL